jgi:hypothetical protein
MNCPSLQILVYCELGFPLVAKDKAVLLIAMEALGGEDV